LLEAECSPVFPIGAALKAGKVGLVASPFAAEHPEAECLLRIADGAPERCTFGIAPGGCECTCDTCEAVDVVSRGFAGILDAGGLVEVDRALVVAAVEGEVGEAM
jgi:hypothetical protein